MSDILEREKADRPNKEGSLRGIEKWKYPADYIIENNLDIEFLRND